MPRTRPPRLASEGRAVMSLRRRELAALIDDGRVPQHRRVARSLRELRHACGDPIDAHGVPPRSQAQGAPVRDLQRPRACPSYEPGLGVRGRGSERSSTTPSPAEHGTGQLGSWSRNPQRWAFRSDSLPGGIRSGGLPMSRSSRKDVVWWLTRLVAAPRVALSPHYLIHNGPLWWLCAECRDYRRSS